MSNDDETTPAGFEAFPLNPRLYDAITTQGYTEPTPIQSAAIPPLLGGRDIIGRARTGSGKTAAFALPLLNAVATGERTRPTTVRGLVLTPTRELAIQVTQAIERYGAELNLRIITLYGGAAYHKQLLALSRGVDIVVGTPGRILDHLNRGSLNLGAVAFSVIDEADEMLRMGFIDDVQTIFAAQPTQRQTALFSATMPATVRRVATTYLRDPVEVEVERRGPVADHIEQRFIRVPDRHKVDALLRLLHGEPTPSSLVFVRTRRAAADVADALWNAGISVDALHGDLDQPARERVVERLRQGRVEVVVATDVAARGLDVPHLARVVNFNLPDDTDTYVHRIGRTGRAGATGNAISLVSPNEGRKVRSLEGAFRMRFTPSPVPTDATIAHKRNEALHTELADAIEPESLELAKQFVLDACARSGRTAEEVAAAAILRLAGPRGITLAIPEDAPPSWAKPPPRRERPRDEHVEVCVPVGRRDGVRVGDLVGALTKGLGLPGAQVGRIRVEDRKSFIGVPRDVAQRWTSDAVRVIVRGEPVQVRLAR